MNSRRMLLAASALGALGVLASASGTACAADAPAAAAPSAGTTLPEVVVTAGKRAEDVQKVAQAVTPVQGQTLVKQGITDVRQIGSLVPGIVLGQDYIYTQIDIRGVGANNDAPALDPAVAFNVDGVYQPRDYGTYGSFFDVDRIEVVRGPQGTLYGRNATGGSINLITKKPLLGVLQGAGEGDIGNYATIRTFGMVNLPVGDNFAIRAALQQSKHNGYLTSGFNDQDSIAGRLQALWKPTEQVSLLVGGDFFHDSSNGAHTIVGLPYAHPDNPWYDPLSVSAAKTAAGADSHFSSWSVHGQLDVDLGMATLTDIGGYKNVLAHGTDPVVGVYSTSDLRDWSVSNELRLASNDMGSPFKWVGGVFFFHEDNRSHAIYFSHSKFFSFDSVTDNPFIRSTSWAAFGQGTYSITPTVRLTGGLRYSIDSKEATGQNQVFLSFGGPSFLSSTTPDDYPKHTWHRLDWRAGVEADLSPTSMAYANVATGFLDGGFNLGAKVGLLPNFDPEKLIAYTVGVKNRFLDGRLQLNLEAFYYDYTDYIVSVYLTSGAATGQFALFNTPAKIYGGELEAVWRLTPNDVLTGNLSLLHARYGTFTQTFVSTGLTNLSGQTLEKAPSAMIQAGYEHTFPMPHGDEVTFSVQTHYESKYWTLFDHTPGSEQPGYTKTNIVVTYRAPGDRWHLQLYVNNIENQAVIATAAPPNSSSPVVPWVHIEEPRLFGMRFGVNF